MNKSRRDCIIIYNILHAHTEKEIKARCVQFIILIKCGSHEKKENLSDILCTLILFMLFLFSKQDMLCFMSES